MNERAFAQTHSQSVYGLVVGWADNSRLDNMSACVCVCVCRLCMAWRLCGSTERRGSFMNTEIQKYVCRCMDVVEGGQWRGGDARGVQNVCVWTLLVGQCLSLAMTCRRMAKIALTAIYIIHTHTAQISQICIAVTQVRRFYIIIFFFILGIARHGMRFPLVNFWGGGVTGTWSIRIRFWLFEFNRAHTATYKYTQTGRWGGCGGVVSAGANNNNNSNNNTVRIRWLFYIWVSKRWLVDIEFRLFEMCDGGAGEWYEPWYIYSWRIAIASRASLPSDWFICFCICVADLFVRRKQTKPLVVCPQNIFYIV